MLNPQRVAEAYNLIKPYVRSTPIIESNFLNRAFGHRILFKYEGAQKIGAFKFRGAVHALLAYRNRHGAFPAKVVTLSSGNHAQAVAAAGRLFNVQTRVYTPQGSSAVKIAATRGYGAEVIITHDRDAAEQAVQADIKQGFYLLHPFDDEDVLLGQGTSCLEALHEIDNIDAIFATCGGGGWLAGTYLAAKLLSPSTKVFGVEPAAANDAYLSRQQGRIVKLAAPPQTIADGARVPAVGAVNFPYLQRLDDLYLAPEAEIIYWTQWLNHLLKVRVEPTSAVTMSGVVRYLQHATAPQRVLVLLSGGNIDRDSELKIWQEDKLGLGLLTTPLEPVQDRFITKRKC